MQWEKRIYNVKTAFAQWYEHRRNVKEAIRGQSKADFISKMSISLKEASETEYWLELLHESDYLSDEQFNSIYMDCVELLKLLTAIINSSKGGKDA